MPPSQNRGTQTQKASNLARYAHDTRCVSERVRPRTGWPPDPLSRIDRDVRYISVKAHTQ